MPDGAMKYQTVAPETLPGAPDIAITFNADEVSVRKALSSVATVLKRRDISDFSHGVIELVLAEACNNIVEHAYENAGEGVIGLTLRYKNGLIFVELSDTGVPMPGLEAPAKKAHATDVSVQDLPEGGFGWGLIRDLTLAMIYRRQGARNLLRLTIEAKPAESR